MADRYWVGGSGNWDATSTTNWAATSGGTAGASAPTSADNVIFDANSNVGTDPFTVTVTGDSGSPSLCNDFTAGSLDGAMTLAVGDTRVVDCYGSMTLPATSFSISGGSTATFNFRATTTGKTITTNGVVFPVSNFVFNGVGGSWTLGSAFVSTGSIIAVATGTFNTGNFNITVGQFATSGSSAKTINLGSSIITITGTTSLSLSSTNLTFNAGTSTFVANRDTTTFNGGGLTFHNVEFSGGAGTKTINGANTYTGQFLVSNAAATSIVFGANQTFTGGALIQATNPIVSGGSFSYTGTVTFTSAAVGTKTFGTNQTFQNLTITAPAVDGITTVSLAGPLTVTGTLTTTDGGSTSRRVQIVSGSTGTQRTVSVGTNSLINTDFRDIAAAGTASWVFGLGYGDLGGNSGITFDNSTLYWIGGTGNWSDGTKWSTSSGGSAANAIPLYQNSVIFDAGSNTGTNPFTVTVNGTSTAPSVCNDFSTGGAGGALDGAMTLTMGATARLDCYGSMTLPATNFTVSPTTGAAISFLATATGKTITTNGVSLSSVNINFNGAGGGWTFGSAMTSSNVNHTAGSVDTGNFNWTVLSGFNSSGTTTRSLSFGSSTYTNSSTVPFSYTGSNLTFNAGTSTIICSAASPTLTGGGLTFYNVSFTSAAAGNTTISGENTFNNLTQTSRSATGIRQLLLNANQTINGTLTLGAANTAIRRIFVFSNALGVQRTITLNGTLATLSDVDFSGINVAGTVATPWTGTRLGNALGNANITFDAPKTVYWNLAGTQNWSATGWATTNNGTPAANNFPLAQDTAVFTEAGSAGTVTIDTFWSIGSIQMSDGVSNRTTAFTLANGSNNPRIFGSVTLFSSLTLTGTGTLQFWGQGTTQTITSAGVSFTQPITIDSPSGTVQLLANTTVSNTSTSAFVLTSGTLDLNEFNLSIAGRFTSNNTNTRSIDFGSAGKILLTFATGGAGLTVFLMGDLTNFSYAGTSYIELNGNNTAGTRTIVVGGSTSGTEAQAMNVFVSAGSDTVSISSGGRYRNLNFTGFSGTLDPNSNTIYGNVILSSTMNTGSLAGTWTFAATSGTQQFNSNGVTLQRGVIINSPSAIFQLQDNLTIPSTATFNLTAGTLDLSSGNRTLSCGLFSSNNTNTRAITFGTGQIDVTGNNAQIFQMNSSNGFTYTGSGTINLTYAGSVGTRNFTFGGTSFGGESTTLNLNVTSGTDTVTIGFQIKNLDFTGFSGTVTNLNINVYGNLTYSAASTLTAGAVFTTFRGTSGIQELTTNGKTLDFPLAIECVGGTVELQDALTIGSTRNIEFRAGTFTTNNYNVTTGRMLFNTTGTRVINMGSSTFTINGFSGANLFWYVEDATNLTINAGTSTINLNKAAVTGEFQAFYSNGFTYHNLNITNSSNAVIYGGDNTFNNISNTYSPVSILFGAGTTQTVNNFTVSGTPGNLVNLESDVPGSVWYLTKTSGTVTVTYCDISDSDANGGASFNCINGVNSGNNTGWNFSSSQFSSGNFLAFF